MGNILPQTAITYAIGCSGEDTIDRGLTNEGGLGAAHTRGCGESCVESMESVRGLVRFVELLPAPSPCQPRPGPAFLRCLSSQALSVL